MGGIVLRHMMALENQGEQRLGLKRKLKSSCTSTCNLSEIGLDAGGVTWAGAVQIGPPNHGSQTARTMSRFPGISIYFK